MTKMKYISIWMVGCMLLSLGEKAQQVVKLDLQRTIEIANDSSLSAFRYHFICRDIGNIVLTRRTVCRVLRWI